MFKRRFGLILTLIVSFLLVSGVVLAGGTLKLDYTDAFNIEYLENGNKIVTDGDGMKWLLVPRGQDVPEGYEGLPVVYTPIKNVLLGSITQACLLRPLGVLDSVIAVTSPLNAWYIDEIKEGFQNETVTFVGEGWSPDFEKIQELNPDYAIVYTGSYPQTALIEKFKELKMPYLVDNEYMEARAFGRMEWIKFMGAFYNKDDVAVEYFENALQEIELLKEKLAGVEQPKVVWGSIYNGKVYVPRAGSYVAEMIALAGGDYVFNDLGVNESGSAEITLEELYAKAIDADIFIYSSWYVSSTDDIVQQAPILADLKSIKEGNVWRYNANWYQSLDRTHKQIIDLASIFYPELLKGNVNDHLTQLPK
ncbi:MAG: ABC transporter substrate-binding protein [Halanaerobiales bacterium]|nr:ABC transporter substrate-binding protein [Halanaerobiales bacterium]